MRRVKMKRGGFLHVYSSHETPPEGLLSMSEAEYAWTVRLAEAKHDPEEKAALWAGIIEAKTVNPLWNVFDAFPVDDDDKSKQAVAMKYSTAILEMLKGRKQ